MRIFIVPLIFTLIVTACITEKTSNDSEQAIDTAIVETKQEQVKTEDFLEVADKFIKAYNHADIEMLESFVSDDFGIKILYNPGAFHVIYSLSSFGELLDEKQSKDLLYLKRNNISCELIYGDIPFYDCDYGWTAEGCYWNDSININLLNIYKGLVDMAVTESDDQFKDEISEINSLITHVIYSTESVIGLYFGLIDKKWCLLCIDKLDPCSA